MQIQRVNLGAGPFVSLLSSQAAGPVWPGVTITPVCRRRGELARATCDWLHQVSCDRAIATAELEPRASLQCCSVTPPPERARNGTPQDRRTAFIRSLSPLTDGSRCMYLVGADSVSGPDSELTR